MELSLQTGTVADRTVLQVSGEVDVYTAPNLRARLLELVTGGVRHLVVDMSRVEFLDSTGLGVLVGGLKRIRPAGGTMVLVCNQERILKIFRITGLEKVFTIVASVDAAVALGESAGTTEAIPGVDVDADSGQEPSRPADGPSAASEDS